LTPLVAFSLLEIPIVTILSAGAVRYLWQLYHREQEMYHLADPRRVTLVAVLAGIATLSFLAGLLLSVPAVTFVINAPVEFRRITGQFVLVAIDLLLPLPLVVALFLRRRRG
jgi:hypothetical protein